MDQICDETTRVYSYSNGYRIRFDMKLARVLRKKTSTASMVWAGLGHGYCPDMLPKKVPLETLGQYF